jgi:hypothetical protein
MNPIIPPFSRGASAQLPAHSALPQMLGKNFCFFYFIPCLCARKYSRPEIRQWRKIP